MSQEIYNKDNMKMFEKLNNISPKYAKHMLLKNSIIENFAKSAFGGIDILDQPVCRTCEKPCAWNTNATAYCFSCGTSTKNPITVRDYLIQEFKLDKEQDLELIEKLSNGEVVEDSGIIIK